MEHKLPSLDDVNTLVVFDTNVWLDLYSYAPKATREICAALERIKNRLWIPHQVQKEFFGSKFKCRDNARKRYSTLEKKYSEPFDRTFKNLSRELRNIASNGYIDTAELVDQLDEQFKKVSEILESGVTAIDQEYQESIKDYMDDATDPINSVVLTIALMCQTAPFSQEEYYAIFGEGAIRFACGIGPGVTDAKKSDLVTPKNEADGFEADRRKFGDLIIWKEVLRHVKNCPINLVFVENEKKRDWWGDCEIGTVPPNLLKEYLVSAPEGSLFMIDLKSFLNEYQKELLLPAGEGMMLVRRLSFRDKVIEYLKENGEYYLSEAVERLLEDRENLYDIIKNIPIRLGFIEEVIDYDIDFILIDGYNVQQDDISGFLFLEGTVVLGCTASVSCYISHDFSVSQEYTFEIQFEASSTVEVNYDDLDADVQDSMEIFECSVTNETLINEELVSDEIYDTDI